ncbi:unnamed protein product [Pelagomonas calceolata]|uniref:RING-type domain-containing protein n=1 Tax=Pelagomonas calceolata TaxID=35677 RepID=A0A8J2X2C4_9STRA|nr:unnamed protein product [Pelagomonas calceolata]
MQALFDAYAKSEDVDSRCFLFKGSRVHAEQTAADLGLVEGDQLDVELVTGEEAEAAGDDPDLLGNFYLDRLRGDAATRPIWALSRGLAGVVDEASGNYENECSMARPLAALAATCKRARDLCTPGLRAWTRSTRLAAMDVVAIPPEGHSRGTADEREADHDATFEALMFLRAAIIHRAPSVLHLREGLATHCLALIRDASRCAACRLAACHALAGLYASLQEKDTAESKRLRLMIAAGVCEGLNADAKVAPELNADGFELFDRADGRRAWPELWDAALQCVDLEPCYVHENVRNDDCGARTIAIARIARRVDDSVDAPIAWDTDDEDDVELDLGLSVAGGRRRQARGELADEFVRRSAGRLRRELRECVGSVIALAGIALHDIDELTSLRDEFRNLNDASALPEMVLAYDLFFGDGDMAIDSVIASVAMVALVNYVPKAPTDGCALVLTTSCPEAQDLKDLINSMTAKFRSRRSTRDHGVAAASDADGADDEAYHSAVAVLVEHVVSAGSTWVDLTDRGTIDALVDVIVRESTRPAMLGAVPGTFSHLLRVSTDTPRTDAGLLRNLIRVAVALCRLAADSDEASTNLITDSLLALLTAAPPSRDVVYVMARALARGGAFLKGGTRAGVLVASLIKHTTHSPPGRLGLVPLLICDETVEVLLPLLSCADWIQIPTDVGIFEVFTAYPSPGFYDKHDGRLQVRDVAALLLCAKDAGRPSARIVYEFLRYLSQSMMRKDSPEFSKALFVPVAMALKEHGHLAKHAVEDLLKLESNAGSITEEALRKLGRLAGRTAGSRAVPADEEKAPDAGPAPSLLPLLTAPAADAGASYALDAPLAALLARLDLNHIAGALAAEEIDIEALPLLSISDLVDIAIKPEDAEKLLVAAVAPPPAAPPPPPIATPSTQECPLCMDGDREIALVPCGHVLCAGCAGRHATESCPMCRQDVASTMRVYF